VSVRGKTAWQAKQRADAALFVGSAVKTFILTRYLKDIEKGRLKASALLTLDDSVRMLSSSVFEHLTGRVPATSVLEAMIAYSDDTATDMAMAEVGVERVRAFIAGAGLESVKVPISTRTLVSYLAGAPYGDDVGWKGVQKIADGKLYGKPRSPMNDRDTMKGSANDFVRYYENILSGSYLQTFEMQREFRRISSQATALWGVVPPNTPAFGKGGSIDWDNFNCYSLPGQMLIGGVVPVTFFFCVNWMGKPSTIPGVFDQFSSAIAATLAATADAFG
jgi:beta-lactamase class A